MRLQLLSIIIYILAGIHSSLIAQVQLDIEIEGPRELQRKTSYKKNQPDPAAAYDELSGVISSLHHRGYLLAEADTIRHDSLRISAIVRPGNQYQFAVMRLGNLSPAVASRLGISEKLFLEKPFRYRELARTFEKIIGWYENHGYPFVSVSIDSLKVEGEKISGSFNVDKHRFYKVDSVVIIGNARLNSKFLHRYLDVHPGGPYNEEAAKAVSGKLRQLPFLTEKRAPEARFTESSNKLYLFLDKKEASQFDGIIGLLPDATTKKTVITGDLKLKLVNGVFRNGETIDLEWRRLQSQTQDFSGRLIYPYLFGTPVGTDYALKIYRRDTTFIDINNNIGVQYYFSGLNNFKVFYRQRTTNLISTSGLRHATALPEYADITTSSYGLGFFLERLDYRFNPHSGIAINTSIQTGNRLIRKNPNVGELAYQGLQLRSTQYQAEGQVSVFIRLAGHNVLRIGLQGATIFGSSVIFRNELFRIGGLKTLRGFDEESIFTSSFVIPTLEYRFLFAENSNLFVFTEGAWYENNSNRQYLQDTPVSVGAGINFETRAGILSISYALGSQFGNGFDARSGKIHFGLTALF